MVKHIGGRTVSAQTIDNPLKQATLIANDKRIRANEDWNSILHKDQLSNRLNRDDLAPDVKDA